MSANRFAFFNGQIVPIEQAQVSVMTHALHYGTAVFGGIRAYWNAEDEQLFMFRPYDHFKRFIQSASLLRMELPYQPEDLVNILAELLRAEDYHESVYVRPLAYKSSEVIGARLHNLDNDVTMFAQPFSAYFLHTGAHVCFSAWQRVNDNAIPARGKIAGAYVNSSMIKTDAVLAGYEDAIVLNEDGHISEMSGANIFVIRDGVVFTPPVNANLLEGIVRRTVIQLLRESLGIEVVERNIDRTEVYIADEIFMCGTGIEIVPITQVEHRRIGDAQPGSITQAVRDLFFRVVAGKEARYSDWLTPVYKHEPVAP